jgi:hypothetical protein
MMLIVLLLSACSGDGESSETKQSPVISIYVYSPAKPIITRAGTGEVAPISNNKSESIITSLQIWVFKTGTTDLVAYYKPESVENLNGKDATGATYQLSVSEAFANELASATSEENRPHVDVFVVANAASCGLTLSETTSKADLKDKLINTEYFGLDNLTQKVPEYENEKPIGLPMSGVLSNVEIGGSSPVYRVGKTELQKVKLTRAVSKIRFVFCREKPADGDGVPISINSITLNEGMIPTSEYLFLKTDEDLAPGEDAKPYHIGSFATGDAKEFLSQTLSDICKSTDPLKYLYQSQTAQAYENLIEEGLTATEPELTQVGPFYLRESDKRLAGKIWYQKQGDTEKSVNFEMDKDLYDARAYEFSRNHTWIVYAYYSKSGLVAVSVVLKDWTDTEIAREVYNW